MSNKLAHRPEQMHPLLRNRWSPRAFADKPIPVGAVTRMLEAAQWAMSSYNGQPWRIVWATKEDAAAYERILGTLWPFNQAWAKSAPMLGAAIARTHFEHNGEPNQWHGYDTGAAMALLSVQAEAEGLKVHQMAGIDAAKAKEALGIPDGYVAITGFAVGYEGDPAILPDQLRERELEPGKRKPLNEVAFHGMFGKG